MKCLNCNTAYQGKYCSQCGQKANTAPISFKAIIGNILSGVMNINRGFLYNLKYITLAPRDTILGFLEGKRVQCYNPFQYAFIGVTILILLEVNYGVSSLGFKEWSENFSGNHEFTLGYETGTNIGKFIRENLKFFWLGLIVLLSFLPRLIYPKYNFAEHLTINSFIIGHSSFLAIACYPILNYTLMTNPIVPLSILFLTFAIFRKEENKWLIGFISIINVVISFVLLIVTSGVIFYTLRALGF